MWVWGAEPIGGSRRRLQRMSAALAPVAAAGGTRPPPRSESVTPLELFFDLVFVFALTQVIAPLAGDPTWVGKVEEYEPRP